MPVVAGDCDQIAAVEIKRTVNDLHSFFHDRAFQLLPVQFTQTICGGHRLHRIIGHQRQRVVRMAEPAGGVQTRRQDIAESLGCDRFAGQPDLVEQSGKTALMTQRQAVQSGADNDPVFIRERHHIGNRAERGQLKVQPATSRRGPDAGKGLHQLQGYADAGQSSERVTAVRPFWIDDGIGIRELLLAFVMVGDNNPQAGLFQTADFLQAGNAAVDSDQRSSPEARIRLTKALSVSP